MQETGLVELWRARLRRCCAALSGLDGVRGLAVVGSGVDETQLDRWSDLDLLVVLADGALDRFWPSLDWLGRLGEVYALDTSSGPDHHTLRACFTDLARVDFLLVAESRLPRCAVSLGPLRGGARVVLDRTGGGLPEALRPGVEAPAGPVAPDDGAFRELERGFRWNAVVAAAKLGRGDLLIGGHLALEMAQACLVLAMMLRDRAAGTRHHRRGDGVPPPLSLPPSLSAEGVADLIAGAAESWRALAQEWDAGYAFPTAPLLALLGRAAGAEAGPTPAPPHQP